LRSLASGYIEAIPNTPFIVQLRMLLTPVSPSRVLDGMATQSIEVH
jgi:ABC-type amino acid transport system permease subunit